MLNYFLTKDFFFFSFHTNKSPFLLYEEKNLSFHSKEIPQKEKSNKKLRQTFDRKVIAFALWWKKTKSLVNKSFIP